jgi:hypothetical protein
MKKLKKDWYFGDFLFSFVRTSTSSSDSSPLASGPSTLSVQIDVGAYQSSIQWVPGDLFPEKKWPVRKSNGSSTSRTQIKNSWTNTSIPHTHLWLGVQLSTEKNLLYALSVNNFFLSCNLQLSFRGKV